MSIIKFVTRGGQLSLHNYQMIKQVTQITLLICFMAFLLSFIGQVFSKTTRYERYLFWQTHVAELKTSIGNASTATQEFKYYNGEIRRLRSKDILSNPSIRAVNQLIEQKVLNAFTSSLWHGGFVLVLLFAFFAYRGHRKSIKRIERGSEILAGKKLAKIIRKKQLDSDLNLNGLPLIRHKETSHILITGTTGSGKSNCITTLLTQIRERGDRAIIVDQTGEYLNRFFRPQDILLNPFHERSEQWIPWADCLSDVHYDQVASAFVPKSDTKDPFWEEAGKAIFSVALQLTKEKKDIEKLHNILVKEDLSGFSEFFRGTEAATYTHADGEKMTLSIRATLANHTKCLKHLKTTDRPFSIRNWVTTSNTPSQCLFLACRPDQRVTMKPLMTTWIDIAINSLMSCPPNTNQRLWFIIDELPSLQKLPSLSTGLAELRKYGGCIMAGIQSVPQLNSIYGSNAAQGLLDLFNTKIFFRNTDPNTNNWISRVIGEAEIVEQVENLSYGANTMRDGVTLNQHSKVRPLITPSEIGTLEDLEAIVKLPANVPVGKIKMSFLK